MLHFHKSNRTRRRGFVLVMVLVAILVVGLALTSTARRSLLSHRNAIDSQKSLQTRWGLISCQRTILPSAGALFDASDIATKRQRGKQKAMPSTIQGRVILGGQTIDLIAADEDAKANLNALYDAGGRKDCVQALSRLSSGLEAKTVRLLPSRSSQNVLSTRRSKQTLSPNNPTTIQSSDEAISFPPAFRSWGEVFDIEMVQSMVGDDRHLAKMTQRIGLFGTGRLNVFRATDETVLAVCQSVIQDGLSRRVLEKVRDTTLGQIDLILEQTITNIEDRRNLNQLLSTSSSSYSLWMEATNRTSRHQRLAIQAPDQNGNIQTWEFSFE